uniref:Uncharacterized protein n=1 Tax=Megaselia scalaris TaxID=36166 RepID=T1GW27_MEGSC
MKSPVLIEDGSFSWGDGEVCIKNINISDDKGYNILFGLPYDKRKYQRVVNACSL